jgi:hypothetical protein
VEDLMDQGEMYSIFIDIGAIISDTGIEFGGILNDSIWSFSTENITSIIQNDTPDIYFYTSLVNDRVFVKGLRQDQNSIYIYNILGQNTATYTNLTALALEQYGVKLPDLIGIHIVGLETVYGLYDTKIIIRSE